MTLTPWHADLNLHKYEHAVAALLHTAGFTVQVRNHGRRKYISDIDLVVNDCTIVVTVRVNVTFTGIRDIPSNRNPLIVTSQDVLDKMTRKPWATICVCAETGAMIWLPAHTSKHWTCKPHKRSGQDTYTTLYYADSGLWHEMHTLPTTLKTEPNGDFMVTLGQLQSLATVDKGVITYIPQPLTALIGAPFSALHTQDKVDIVRHISP